MGIFGPPNIENLKKKRAVDKLRGILGHPDIKLGQQAADALQELGWKPTEKEDETAFYFARQNWGSLNDLSQDAITMMVGSLSNKDLETQEHVIKAIGDAKDARAVPPLLKLIGKSDRLNSCLEETLIKIGQGSAEALLDLLKKNDRWDKELNNKKGLSTRVLFKINYQGPVGPLIEAWSEEAKKRLEGYTAAAAWAVKLNRFESIKSRYKPLIQNIEKIDMSTQYHVRLGILTVLCNHQDPQTKPILQEALQDESKQVRDVVPVGFGKFAFIKKDITRFCDICSIGLDENHDEIHLLTTRQIVRTPNYWSSAFSRLDAIMGENNLISEYYSQSTQSMVLLIAAREDPWLVCGKCINLFPGDHSESRQNAAQWISSGGKILPSKVGPAGTYEITTGNVLLDGKIHSLRS